MGLTKTDDFADLDVSGRTPGAWFSASSIVWLTLYAANLIIPLMFGWSMVNSNGAVGLTLAVAFSAVFGFVYITTYPWIRRPALLGAAIVAVSQFWPLLQIGAGLIGLGLATTLSVPSGQFRPHDGEGNLGFVSGFYATFVTGQVLILLSLMIGWILCQVGRLGYLVLRISRTTAL